MSFDVADQALQLVSMCCWQLGQTWDSVILHSFGRASERQHAVVLFQ